MLYLVATPIGNLGDITLRALETLRTVDLIASEDTRKTGILLKHFEIHKPQLSFHEHNEAHAGERIFGLLRQGKQVAVVTDADHTGASIAQVLKDQSVQMRLERFVRAEKAGARASQTMLIPMMMFILPAVFIMVFAPVILQFFYGGS